MKFPNYPSNREADARAMATVCLREGARKDEAKSGNLFTV